MSFDNLCKILAEKYHVEQLENLGAALFNISEVADLVTWLNQPDNS